MAKRKKKKDTKRKIAFSIEVYGIILVLIGVLGICGYGIGGKLICSFFAFLFGSLYLIPLILLVFLGIYVMFVKEYPDFLGSKSIGLSLLIIGLLILVHVNYVSDSTTWEKIIKDTFNETINVF